MVTHVNPINSDRKLCLSESLPCHEPSLSESPTQISTILISELCHKVNVVSSLYCQTDPCQNPVVSMGRELQIQIERDCFLPYH